MDWLRWCTVLVVLVTVRGFDCPEGKGCGSCQTHPEGWYEIDCTTSTDNVFKIRITPGRSIDLSCPFGRTTNWTELDLSVMKPIEGINRLYFTYCDLPTNNRLGEIAHQLLNDNVERLDFKSYKNLSSQLTREHLREFRHIKNMTLSSNNLSILPEDLLQDFENLTLLNLLENNLRHLPENFLRVPNLRVLELGINKLESLSANTFDKLERLLLLNIWSNNIVKILPHTFDNLAALMTLDIHRNLLESMPSGIFARLSKLRTINLSQNNFTLDSLPADLFRNNSELVTVFLFETKRNMTTLPSGLFANLPKLKTVKLRKNGFLSLPEDLFWSSTNLENVGLERNYLLTLPSKFFRDSHNLLTLDLNFNDLQSLPDDVFAPLTKLTKLDLSRNHLSSVSENLFSGLLSLQELNMERNNLTTIHIDAFNFLQNLRIAKFSYNALTLRSSQYQPTSPFQTCKKISELYLAHNNIKEVFDDWKHTLLSLKILNLAHNRIQSLEGGNLQYLSARADNHVKVDFSFNNISYVDMRTVELWATGRNQPEWLTISIENNPIRCDCSLYDLLRYLEGRMNINVTNAFYLKVGNLKCATPNDLRGIAISNLRSNKLKCELDSLGEETIYCPQKCNCYVRPDDTAIIIDCARKGLTKAPEKLECLPYHHIELNMSGNFLTKMPTFDRPGYDKVTVLTLDHNNISSLSVNTLSDNLKVLNLNNNNLTRMDPNVIDFFKNSSSLNNLMLQANPWMCDCDARDFLNFIQAKRTTIPDLLKVTCYGQNVPISEMTPEELCPVEIEWIVGGCLLVAFLGILIGSLAALYYRYQREVKVWLYARQWCLWFVTEDELDKDKKYDAFVSFSHKDEDFIVNEMIPNLEQCPRPLKLCIHFRDWLAGEWIPNQIARSVEESRRTVVVLSPNFLESVWGRMEFRAAHSQALSEGRARVIVILYGDIGPTDDLDPELKAYLSMNTYVKWGDPWFWEKLKYALPHPPEFTKGNMRRKIFETTQPRIHIGNDKSELIHTSGGPATPPAASTPPADSVKLFIPNDDVTHNEADKLSVKDLNTFNNGGLNNGTVNNGALPTVITKCNPKVNNLQCTTV